MEQNKSVKINSQNSGAQVSLVILGNSSKSQLKAEAKQWVKQAQKESKVWGKFFAV